jgi:single-strand DNA-binding protein
MPYQVLIIQGNLGRDPEIKTAQSGKSVCRFSVAVSDKGPRGEHTEWFRCVAFDKTAEIVAQYVRKGDPILVEGRLKTEEYEKDGEKKKSTDVLVSRVTLLGGKRDRAETPAPAPTPAPAAAAGFVDDDLPFSRAGDGVW